MMISPLEARRTEYFSPALELRVCWDWGATRQVKLKLNGRAEANCREQKGGEQLHLVVASPTSELLEAATEIVEQLLRALCDPRPQPAPCGENGLGAPLVQI